jgi:hypothetical protein
MPKLWEYADSNEKEGMFIRASVGKEAIITLQVSPVAERLFRMLEYHPPAVVPSKLVWEMYDVGLLFTINSLATEGSSGGDATAVLDEADDSSLSPDEKAEIIEELEAYSGPGEEHVEELAERLDGASASTLETQPTETEGIALLRKWATDPEAVDRCVESYAIASIQTFVNHPYLVSPPVRISDEGYIIYKVKKGDRRRDVSIFDHRPKSNWDFKIKVVHTVDKREFARVRADGTIVTYRNKAGNIGSRMNITGISDWAIPSKQIRVDIPVAVSPEGRNEIHEYRGTELEPIRDPQKVDEESLMIVEVDRISGGDNPIVQFERGHMRLDQGEPGEEYLVERVSNNKGRVISRVI